MAHAQDHGRRRALHVDQDIAALSALAVAITIIGLAIFGSATAWSDAPVAMGIAAVVCCLYATADDPTPMVRNFLVWVLLLAIPISALYFVVILPAIDDFILLAIVLLPVIGVIGLMQASPKHVGRGLPLAVGFTSGLALQPRLTGEFDTFVSLNIALIVGLFAALASVSVLRALRAEMSPVAFFAPAGMTWPI